MKTCSQCKKVWYCSVQCQKQDWLDGGHKGSCGGQKQKITKESSTNFSESDTEALIDILRNQFVDIPKIISLVDPNRATDFKKRNQLAHMAKHTHDSQEGSCCSVQNKIYIEQKDLSSVERAINEVLTSASFFKSNLKEILDKVDAAQKSMKNRAQERGMVLDEAMEKELLSKCLMETVNRQIFSHVYTQLKKQDQTYSKQPGLLAHPQTVIGQSDCNLD